MFTPLCGKFSRKGHSHISGGESVSLAVELSYSYSHDSTTTQARRSTWYDTRTGVCHATSFDAQKATTKQVTEIANSQNDFAEAQSKPSIPQGLQLPPVRLSTFKGDPQDNLSRFLEHSKSIVSFSTLLHCLSQTTV